MTIRLATRRLTVCAVVVLALAATAAGVDAGRAVGTDQNRPDDSAAESGVLIVDDDGGADYAAVEPAVEAADPGDTVRVMPGTYRESVTVDENVTLVAPRGATLDGSTLADDADAITMAAAPVVDGFTVVDYSVAVDTTHEAGDWVLRNATIRNTSFIAVNAGSTAGDWRLDNVTIRDVDTGTGIDAVSSTGDWRATDVVVRNVTQGRAVDASPSSGNWTLADVTVADVAFAGVEASYTSGDWTLANTTVRDATVGVGAIDASGDWTVRGSTVANVSVSERYGFSQPPLEEGVGIYAADTNGSWAVRGSRFADNEAGAIAAPDADPAGDATLNWWGDADGPGDACSGGVDCGDPLSTWPPETPVGTPTPVAPDAAGTTTTGPQTTEEDPASGGTDVPASASRSGTQTDTAPTPAVGSGATADGGDSTASASRTTAAGPLSPILAVLGLVVGGLLVGRCHWWR